MAESSPARQRKALASIGHPWRFTIAVTLQVSGSAWGAIRRAFLFRQIALRACSIEHHGAPVVHNYFSLNVTPDGAGKHYLLDIASEAHQVLR